MELFKAGEDFELMAQRARRHWALSDATRTKGIGGIPADPYPTLFLRLFN